MDDAGKPIFFLSYSIDKAIRPDTVNTFIELLKDTITQSLQYQYLDLFEDSHPGTIHGDLIAALRNCDCLIAEATNAAPNVYFEMGVADALGKPLITFLDQQRDATQASSEAREVALFRERFFGSAHPSDLGDLRYFNYWLSDPGQVSDAAYEAEVQKVRRLQRTVISDTVKKYLQDAVRAPRRNLEMMFFKGLKAISDHSKAEPKLWLIDGLSAYVSSRYGELPKQPMRVDESIYESMLKAMGSHMHVNSIAIADRQGGQEPFLLASDPADVKVGERIFTFDSKDAFSSEFEVDDIWKHSREYQCYMIDRTYVVREMQRSGLAQETNASGVNIMSTGDTSAWYVRDPERPHEIGRELLVIDSRSQIQKKIEAMFGRLRDKAVNISALGKANLEATSTAARTRLIKAEWLRRRDIGRWEVTWTASDRDNRYYADYENHIRAWIPDYHGLTTLFVERAEKAALEMGHSAKFVVVEAGPGTGEVTERVLRRIAHSARAGRESQVAEYRVYEKDAAMLDRMAERGLIERKNQGFVSKIFGGDGGLAIPVTPKKKLFIGPGETPASISHDVLMLGSLVHHYIDVLDHDEPDFGSFLDATAKRFPTTRQIVLAGVFYDDDRKPQIEQWTQWMKRSGLTDDAVREFFEGNAEMQRPFTISELRAAAHGRWDVEHVPINWRYPFGVIHLKQI